MASLLSRIFCSPCVCRCGYVIMTTTMQQSFLFIIPHHSVEWNKNNWVQGFPFWIYTIQQPLLLSDLYSQERVASHSLDALTIRSIGRESLITITKRLKVQFKRHDISKVEERTEQTMCQNETADYWVGPRRNLSMIQKVAFTQSEFWSLICQGRIKSPKSPIV